MPSLIFKTDEQRQEHNERCRHAMRKTYDTCNGREKSSLKYYKRKYADDEEAMSILMNPDIDVCEKAKQMKIYNFNKKMGV